MAMIRNWLPPARKAGRVLVGRVQVGRVLADRRAVTALEYGIIASFFCVGLVALFTSFGTSVSGLFNTIITRLN